MILINECKTIKRRRVISLKWNNDDYPALLRAIYA